MPSKIRTGSQTYQGTVIDPGASLPIVIQWGWRGGRCAPFEPPASCAPTGLARERAALPPLLPGGAPMGERRTGEIHVRVSLAEREQAPEENLS